MSRTYVGEPWSRGKEVLRQYCNDLSTPIRCLVDFWYLRNTCKILREMKWRFPETKSAYIDEIRDIISMFQIEQSYGRPLSDNDVLVRAVSRIELNDYLQHSDDGVVITSPRSYCLSEKDALRYARDTGKVAIIKFEYQGKQLYVNDVIQPRFDNERESIVTGGIVKKIKYVETTKDGVAVYTATLEESHALQIDLDGIAKRSMVLREYETQHDFSGLLKQNEEWRYILGDENDDTSLILTYPQAINAYINGEIGEELFEDKGFLEWIAKMECFVEVVFASAKKRAERSNGAPVREF